MSEGTHSPLTPLTTAGGMKNKLTLILAGTAAVVLVTGILFQIFRPPVGNAQEGAGRVKLNGDTANQQSERPKRYLARVNKELVTWEEVAMECMAREAEGVLENIINRKIIQQACADQRIEVTAAEVKNEVTKIAARFKLPVDTWYQMLLAERGLSRVQYQRDVIWPMLALKKLAGEKVAITENDLQKLYIRDYGEKVKVRMILMDNFRRAQAVWQKAIKSPQDFERLAREHSIEPNSRALGGSIPPIRRYSGNETLEKAAFKLRTGEISGIIQVGNERYVILLCEGRTKVVAEYSEVKDLLHDQLVEEKKQELVAEVFDKLKREAQVDNYLTSTRTGGVRRTSATKKATNSILPAGGTSRRGTYPPSSTPSLPGRTVRP